MTAPYDKILTIDFETYWDTKEGYTLTKMTTEEYIRHDLFHAFGCCVHEFGTDSPTTWVRGEGLREYFSGIDWGRTAVLAHNAQFDVSIMEWVYDTHPAFIFDTLSMARALRGVEVGNSLAKLAIDFGLPAKGTAVYSTNGVAELDEVMESELADYCKHDVYLCERIFDRLVKGYPPKELRLIDMTLKMYTRACLQLDPNMLTDAILEEKETREALLQKLRVDETALASNPQFAALLEALGVVAPRKISKTTGKETLALAKNDALFQALLNGEREDVALLCEARLRVKSTTERTRAQRFLDISKRGTLPVPLSYYGAQTGRWTASRGSAITCKTSSEARSYAKQLWLPKDTNSSSVTYRRLSREYWRGYQITQTCWTSSGVAVTLTPRLERRCLTYPDLVKSLTLTFGNLRRARCLAADTVLAGRLLLLNSSQDSSGRHRNAMTWPLQRSLVLLSRQRRNSSIGKSTRRSSKQSRTPAQPRS